MIACLWSRAVGAPATGAGESSTPARAAGYTIDCNPLSGSSGRPLILEFRSSIASATSRTSVTKTPLISLISAVENRVPPSALALLR